jgi:hypothetical protein
VMIGDGEYFHTEKKCHSEEGVCSMTAMIIIKAMPVDLTKCEQKIIESVGRDKQERREHKAYTQKLFASRREDAVGGREG